MSYRNKTYIIFDADTDMNYYRLMTAWVENDKIDFNFHNAHHYNDVKDTDTEDQIKRKLRERLKNTKQALVLVGEKTKNLHRYVRWEQEVALELNIPIVAVNLNKMRSMDPDRCPPIIRDKLVVHVGFYRDIIKHALDGVEAFHKANFGKKTGAHSYGDSVYKQLGINIS